LNEKGFRTSGMHKGRARSVYHAHAKQTQLTSKAARVDAWVVFNHSFL